MKIKPNYLYRVLGDLEKEGRVKKKGRKYYPGLNSRSRNLARLCERPAQSGRPLCTWLCGSRSGRAR